MGSKQSSSSYGSLKILNMKDIYTAGDTVTGTIEIDLQQSYPANKLIIQIIGLEKTSWSKWVGKSKVPFQGNQIIYCNEIEIPLNVQESRFSEEFWLPIGIYNYPFLFKLNSNLPSSVEKVFFGSNDDFQAEVKYKMIASMKANGGNISKMKAEKCLNVLEQYKIRGRRELRAKQSVEVKISHFFNILKTLQFLGSTTSVALFELNYPDFPVRKNSKKRDNKTSISCELLKGNYCQGENITGRIQIDNTLSPQIIKAIEYKLKSKVMVKDNHEKTQQIVFTLNQNQRDQIIDKGSSQIITFELKCENQKQNNKQLPSSCNFGKIIKIEYFILINVKYQNQNITDARLQIPITIQNKIVSLEKVEAISLEEEKQLEKRKPHSEFDLVEIKLNKSSKFKLSNRKISKF